MTLLPCPFCGNSNRQAWDGVQMRQQTVTSAGYGLPLEHPEARFYVFCGYCGARGGIGQSGRTANGSTTTPEQAEEIAARKWNTRAKRLQTD